MPVAAFRRDGNNRAAAHIKFLSSPERWGRCAEGCASSAPGVVFVLGIPPAAKGPATLSVLLARPRRHRVGQGNDQS